MVYKVILSPRAQQEIDLAASFYFERSIYAGQQFKIALQMAFNHLETFPFQVVRYKNIRSLKLKRFPFSLFYIASDKRPLVKALDCFHNI